jgi:hypothetical protein
MVPEVQNAEYQCILACWLLLLVAGSRQVAEVRPVERTPAGRTDRVFSDYPSAGNLESLLLARAPVVLFASCVCSHTTAHVLIHIHSTSRPRESERRVIMLYLVLAIIEQATLQLDRK